MLTARFALSDMLHHVMKKSLQDIFPLLDSDEICIESKLCCDSRFQRAITACSCVFKVITLIGSNQGNFFENPTACSKRTLKTTVATQLKEILLKPMLKIQYFILMKYIRGKSGIET